MELRICLLSTPQTVQSTQRQCRNCHRGELGLRQTVDLQHSEITRESPEVAGANPPVLHILVVRNQNLRFMNGVREKIPRVEAFVDPKVRRAQPCDAKAFAIVSSRSFWRF